MDTRSIEDLIKGRRSIRKWAKKEVPDDLLKKGVELGTWAPNGGNYQVWYFYIIKNRDIIERMAKEVQRVADKIVSWQEAKAFEGEMVRSRQSNATLWREAPAVIAVLTYQYVSLMDTILIARESFDLEAKRILSFRRSAPTGIQSAAAAVTTMLLVFHQMGLGAVWLGQPLLAKKEIEDILEVSENMNLVCLVAVGYPNESPQKDRRPLEQVMKFIG